MTTLDAVCPNYEVVFPVSGEALLTFDLDDVPTPLPTRAVALRAGNDGLVVRFDDGRRQVQVQVHFEALPPMLRDQLADRSSLLVCALNEQGVAFVNDVQIDWSKP